MTSPFPRDGWLLLFPPLFWAINTVVGRALAGHFPPVALSLGRWALAFLIFLPFAWKPFRQHLPALRSYWRAILFLSLLGVGLYTSLLYLALITSSPVNVLLIGACAPSFVLLARAMIERTLPSRRALLAAALSVLGVLLVSSRGDLSQLFGLRFTQGDLVMIVATLVWVAYTLVLQSGRPPVPVAPLVLTQFGAGALFLLPCALLEWLVFAPVMEFDGKVWLSLLYVAIFPSILAYLCWDRGVAAAGAEIATVLANLAPVIAAVLAWAVLGEAIGWHHLLAAVLIFTAIRLSTHKPA
ncbi:MAG TPA: DMT family transporter [Geminicoccus sp.]|nr:DMT family transporter [Geminicoccus sp.]